MLTEKTLQRRVLTLVGQRPAPGSEACFACGGTTALGRATTVVDGKKVVSCWRAECMDALKRMCQTGERQS
jgi:putative intracellular protease/amidase